MDNAFEKLCQPLTAAKNKKNKSWFSHEKRGIPVLLIVILTFAACSTRRESDSAYPSKPITIIVPAAAGGGTDIWTRSLAEVVREYLGQPLVVVNKKGAAGAIGISAGMQASPDGYTLTAVFVNVLFIPHVQNVPEWFSYRNLEPICLYNKDPGTITVNAGAPWNSVEEFIEAARNGPQKIKAAVPPPGGAYYFIARSLEEAIGARFVLIPYGGASPSIVATAGAHTDVTFYSPAEVINQVEAGNLKVLAVLSEKRNPLFPEVPTLSEKTIEMSAGSWRGIVAPAGTPPERIELLNGAFKKALESDFIKTFSQRSGMSIDYLGPEGFRSFMESENDKYSKLIAGLESKP